MKVSIENLGAVKSAEVEVGNLTIIAGENSTGKTNIVYTIYDVIKNTRNYFKFVSKNNKIDKILQELLKNEDLSINADKLDLLNEVELDNQKDTLKNKYLSRVLLKNLSKDFKIDISNNLMTYDLNDVANHVMGEFYVSVQETIENLKNKDNVVEVKWLCYVVFDLQTSVAVLGAIGYDYDKSKYSDREQEIINEFLDHFDFDIGEYRDSLDLSEIKEDFVNYMNNELKSKAKIEIATSDRSGIISFLSDNQKKLRQATREAYNSNNNSFLSSMIYTKPTNDNIDFLNGLPDIVNVRKRNAKIEENSNLKENYLLKDVYEEIEKLIGGTLHITQMGEVYFTMFHSKTEEESLKFVNLSSSIKNLTMIYFQLKYSETFSTIDENTYYAIDEPEAFLHPMNQIKMARIIAMLVNKGVKVILTTHSDYLIRELNSLVTLGSIDMSDLDKKDLDNFTDVKKDMLLNIKDKSINIYVMDDKGGTNQQEITEYGFYFKSFTNAVDKQNQTINFTHDIVRKNRRDKDDD